jgi:hypothetical protein
LTNIEKKFVFSGDAYFSCVWFEHRGGDVIELQFGSKLSTTPSFDLCDNSRFLQKTWNTQASESFEKKNFGGIYFSPIHTKTLHIKL